MEKRFEGENFNCVQRTYFFIKLIYTNNKIKNNLFIKGPNVQISLIFLQTNIT